MSVRKEKNKTEILPKQEVLKKVCLKPGRQADLVLSTDLDKNFIDVRSSTLHDIHSSGKLIFGQTEPLIRKNQVNKTLEITFLAKFQDRPGGRWLRVGYKTKLLGLVENFRLSKNYVDTILIVDKPEKLVQSTLRLDFRLVPPLDQDLRLYLWPDEIFLPIVDISLGGVKFSHDPFLVFELRSVITLSIKSQKIEIILNAKVLRETTYPKKDGPRITETAVQFQNMSLKDKKTLSGILHKFLRQRLAHRSGMLGEYRQ